MQRKAPQTSDIDDETLFAKAEEEMWRAFFTVPVFSKENPKRLLCSLT